MNPEQNQNGNIPADEIYREQVYTAGYDLLSGLDALTDDQDGGGNLQETFAFVVAYEGMTGLVEKLRRIALRAQVMAATATEALDLAEAARTWMVSGLPMRCVTCGYDIDPVPADDWRICRDLPEHIWCHEPNDVDRENRGRGWVLADDELAAYCEDRERAGGPFHDDEVELRFPDGRTVRGTWYVPGPAPLSEPIVLDCQDTEISPAGAQIHVIGLGEDTTEYFASSVEDLARGAELAARWGEVGTR